MDTKKIMNFMLQYEILYTVIVELKSCQKITYGWEYKLPYKGLLSSFQDEESIKEVNEYLEGQVMPRSMGQGKERCVLCKPNSNILVGLFYTDTKDIVESYNFEKQLNNKLAEIVNS